MFVLRKPQKRIFSQTSWGMLRVSCHRLLPQAPFKPEDVTSAIRAMPGPELCLKVVDLPSRSLAVLAS